MEIFRIQKDIFKPEILQISYVYASGKEKSITIPNDGKYITSAKKMYLADDLLQVGDKAIKIFDNLFYAYKTAETESIRTDLKSVHRLLKSDLVLHNAVFSRMLQHYQVFTEVINTLSREIVLSKSNQEIIKKLNKINHELQKISK